jgi:hypothetical protein
LWLSRDSWGLLWLSRLPSTSSRHQLARHHISVNLSVRLFCLSNTSHHMLQHSRTHTRTHTHCGVRVWCKDGELNPTRGKAGQHHPPALPLVSHHTDTLFIYSPLALALSAIINNNFLQPGHVRRKRPASCTRGVSIFIWDQNVEKNQGLETSDPGHLSLDFFYSEANIIIYCLTH